MVGGALIADCRLWYKCTSVPGIKFCDFHIKLALHADQYSAYSMISSIVDLLQDLLQEPYTV